MCGLDLQASPVVGGGGRWWERLGVERGHRWIQWAGIHGCEVVGGGGGVVRGHECMCKVAGGCRGYWEDCKRQCDWVKWIVGW